jgi:YidC/Oxa1 family membrane protein insertase
MISITHLIESAIQFFHLSFGSWPIAIAILALSVKFILLPVQLFQYRQQRRMAKIQPCLDQLTIKHKDEPRVLLKKMSELKRGEGIKTGWSFLTSLVQIPLFLSIYRGFVGLNTVFSGGFAWIPSFASPDPFYIFPLIVAGGSYLQSRYNHKTQIAPKNEMNKVLKWMPALSLIFMASLPASLTLYYAVSGILNIVSDYGFRRWA